MVEVRPWFQLADELFALKAAITDILFLGKGA